MAAAIRGVRRHDLVRVHQEQREQRPLRRGADPPGDAVVYATSTGPGTRNSSAPPTTLTASSLRLAWRKAEQRQSWLARGVASRWKEDVTRARAHRLAMVAATALAVAASAGTTRDAAAALPPGNTVAQWNKIAEDTAVGSGAFQAEGFIYMAYASTAVYNSVVAIEGGQEPLLGSTITAPAGTTVDCAVVEAAYRMLRYYFSSFPVLVANLDADYAEPLSPGALAE